PVLCGADHGQLRLVLDERAQRLQERAVVVRQQDSNRGRSSPIRLVHQGTDVSLAAVGAQPAGRQVSLIGAPLDLGAGRRGVDMGPSAIRYAELAEHLRDALGIETDDHGNVEAPVAEAVRPGGEDARFLPEILELCERVAVLVAEATRAGSLPIVL